MIAGITRLITKKGNQGAGKVKLISVGKLTPHPLNYKLAGHISKSKRAGLKADIKKNGIREALQVWQKGGDIFVLSGNERLEIAIELKSEKVPCVFKEFEHEHEALQFLRAVNHHRKESKTITGQDFLLMYPVDAYPLLYADLRGNYDYSESEKDESFVSRKRTKKEQKEALEKRKKQRVEQKIFRNNIILLSGMSKPVFEKLRLQANATRNKKPHKQTKIKPPPTKKMTKIQADILGYIDTLDVKEKNQAIRDLLGMLKKIKLAISQKGGPNNV